MIPLVLAALVSLAGFIIAGNSMIRERVENITVQNLSGRMSEVVNGYFAPFLNFVNGASLWAQIGDLSSIGEPALYVDRLYQYLAAMGSVSSFSMIDEDGRELALVLNGEDEYYWFETVPSDGLSLISHRYNAGVEYLKLADWDQERGERIAGDYPFRISTPYILPDIHVLGLTIRANLSAGEGEEEGSTIWLDLPLETLGRWMTEGDLVQDAVIFLMMPNEEFILLDLKDILNLTDQSTVDDLALSHVGQTHNDTIMADALRIASHWEGSQNRQVRFINNDREWQSDFRILPIADQKILIGVLVPVESLWIQGFVFPLQAAVALFFGILTLLAFLTARDFRRSTRIPTEAEKTRNRIALGESSTLEFKSSLRWDYREECQNKDLEAVVLKSLAAFSNRKGGTLFIGVADDGRILGLENDYACLKRHDRDYFELHLRSLISAQYGPSFASNNISITFPVLDLKDLCRIDVKKGKKPVYTIVAGKGGPPREKFYVRTGNSSRAIEKTSEIIEYVANRFSMQRLTRKS